MNAEIVTVGTELLLGEIVDTNSSTIARYLRDIGFDLYCVTTVGDNEERVARAVSAALERADVVITTGGLGPTVDDVTREAVAEATSRPLELSPDLLEQIADRFKRWGANMSSNNRRQARIPKGAIALSNPVGTAPCFIVETQEGVVISLPGVPREMIYMMEHTVIPYLMDKMGEPAVILTRVLRTAGVGESQVDAAIQDLERCTNPTVGLAAHAGQTDIRVTAKAASAEEAGEMMEPIVAELRNRLGVNIYGEENETVEEVLLRMMSREKITLGLAEVGTEGSAGQRLAVEQSAAQVVAKSLGQANWIGLAAALGVGCSNEPEDSLAARAQKAGEKIRIAAQADVGLSILIERDHGGHPTMAIGLATSLENRGWERGYGGPPEYATTWACTLGFDRLRRRLLQGPIS